MARGDVRIAVTLACEECKRRNYQTEKSKRNDPDRIELRKYCRWCGRHTRAQGDPLRPARSRAGIRGSPMARDRQRAKQRQAERRARRLEQQGGSAEPKDAA